MPGKKKKNREPFFYMGQNFDFALLFIIIFLVCFGLVMVYSTSSYMGNSKYGDSAYYVKRQALFAVVGVILMFAISCINYQTWKRFSKLMYVVCLGLLAGVFVIGATSHGAVRWYRIGSIQFQPSEVAKFILILYIAHLATANSRNLKSIKDHLIFLILPMIPIGLIASENLSTAIICGCILIAILFVTSPKTIPFFVVGIACVILVVIFLKVGAGASGYRMERIAIWQDLENHPDGYQIRQALYAIGSGGLWGKGLGQSIQKMGFVPESHNDMIFSIICEELGLFGAICVIAIFALLIWRFMLIANSAPDLYGALIIVGVLTHIAIQVLINIAVVTNTIPSTGVTLPFISYGGTSLVMLLAEMGLVLSVSRQIRYGR